MKVFEASEVARHDKEGDCWVILDGKVYDVSKFAKFHPGGTNVLIKYGGKDATDEFNALHNVKQVLSKYEKRLLIGTIGSAKAAKRQPTGGLLSTPFGENHVPYAEPYWYRGTFKSPFCMAFSLPAMDRLQLTHPDTEDHCRFREKMRTWVEKDVAPYIQEWEEAQDYPRDLHQRAYAAGIYGACWPAEHGGTPPQGGFDPFMDLVFWDELARYGGGWLAACFLTINIALPPVLALGSDYLKELVCRPCITGEKVIALAVTEPWAGSDVANIRTTARREGDHYIVNGEKKFITSGMKADFFTTAVRTGGDGMKGITLLLIERNSPGITTRKLKTQGWSSSNTAYITFEDVRVPVKNVVGAENQGFLAIMLNFNHERFAGIAMTIRGCRLCIEEAAKYARNRKTFNKRLADHQVIRHKIAEMVRQTEAAQAWLEQITFQMKQGVNPAVIGGSMALLKVHCTKLIEFCAREASQVFGGNSCLRTGVGSRVERIYRDVRIGAIGGGSEEVMRDLAMRQARL